MWDKRPREMLVHVSTTRRVVIPSDHALSISLLRNNPLGGAGLLVLTHDYNFASEVRLGVGPTPECTVFLFGESPHSSPAVTPKQTSVVRAQPYLDLPTMQHFLPTLASVIDEKRQTFCSSWKIQRPEA